MRHLLFVCTGNTCRSPMAAQIARHAVDARALGWTVQSAGLYAVPGLPIAGHAAQALMDLGITPTPHAATQVTAELVNAADAVLAMTSSHAWELRAMFPSAFDKIHELGVFATIPGNPLAASCDIVDPYGGSLEQYALCARALRGYVEAAIAKLAESDETAIDNEGRQVP